MRAAVEARSMTPLVSLGGTSAAQKMVDELKNGSTLDNFDPLMAMHWNIATNLLEKLGKSGLYLMSTGPEDPIDVSKFRPIFQEKYHGRTWPRCPICYANIAHEISCREARCTLAIVDGWDVCIEFAADAIKIEFEKMMAQTVNPQKEL